MEELQERVTELEIRFSHQSRMMEELNGVVIECNRRIALLERESRLLRATLKSLAPELPQSPDE